MTTHSPLKRSARRRSGVTHGDILHWREIRLWDRIATGFSFWGNSGADASGCQDQHCQPEGPVEAWPADVIHSTASWCSPAQPSLPLEECRKATPAANFCGFFNSTSP